MAVLMGQQLVEAEITINGVALTEEQSQLVSLAVDTLLLVMGGANATKENLHRLHLCQQIHSLIEETKQ